MKKTHLLLLAVAVLLLMSSCGNKTIYTEQVDFSNNIWNRFDKKNIKIPFTSDDVIVDISIAIKYNNDLQYNNVAMYAILTLPSGEERFREIHVPINRILDKKIEADSVYETQAFLWRGVNVSEEGTGNLEIENMIPYFETKGIKQLTVEVLKSGSDD
ncbi:MAG: hypothetical protein ACOXZ9_00180 [Bacteroidales bacterium]|jgi:hypothetical protein